MIVCIVDKHIHLGIEGGWWEASKHSGHEQTNVPAKVNARKGQVLHASNRQSPAPFDGIAKSPKDIASTAIQQGLELGTRRCGIIVVTTTIGRGTVAGTQRSKLGHHRSMGSIPLRPMLGGHVGDDGFPFVVRQ